MVESAVWKMNPELQKNGGAILIWDTQICALLEIV